MTGEEIGAQCLCELLGCLLGDTIVRIEPTRHVKPGLLLQKQPGPGAAVMAEDMLGGPWMVMGRHRL